MEVQNDLIPDGEGALIGNPWRQGTVGLRLVQGDGFVATHVGADPADEMVVKTDP